jgi:hypothetical protein
MKGFLNGKHFNLQGFRLLEGFLMAKFITYCEIFSLNTDLFSPDLFYKQIIKPYTAF